MPAYISHTLQVMQLARKETYTYKSDNLHIQVGQDSYIEPSQISPTETDRDQWTCLNLQMSYATLYMNLDVESSIAATKSRQYRWARLVDRVLDLCLAMRLPGRSASRLLLASLSCTSRRTPSNESTACKPHRLS